MKKNIKIVTVVGARPQFIKAAVVSRAIAAFNAAISSISVNSASRITELIIHTGQHYDYNMSKVFFREMQIPEPTYNLNINGLNHGAMTGQMLEKIEGILLKEKPDLVIVYGDTNSTLAGALAAKKLHIKAAHIEAGLRSFNMNMPEEINRILTDRISDILFCPTETAVNNLKKEGYPGKLTTNNCQLLTNVGDIMYDAALFYERFARPPEIFKIQNPKSEFTNYQFILSTLHRAENTDDPERLKNILDAFIEISKTIPIILPLHPRTKKIIQNLQLEIQNLQLIEPVSYFEMIWLLKNCKFVMTDSGGLQKEAFFFKKPCITLREETEWCELVENKYNFIVGWKRAAILDMFRIIKTFNFSFSKKFYGEGDSGARIVKFLYEYFNG